MNLIVTTREGWQEDCWKQAKRNQDFEIEGIRTAQHIAFCNSLAMTYRYHVVQAKTRATFIPSGPALKNQLQS